MLFGHVAGPAGADGTYLAELKPPRNKGGPAVTVRVIEDTVPTTAGDGGEQTSEVFCLVIDLLDVEECPALDLAGLAFAAFLATVLMAALLTRGPPRPGQPAQDPGRPAASPPASR
jgi:hypothetical protein